MSCTGYRSTNGLSLNSVWWSTNALEWAAIIPLKHCIVLNSLKHIFSIQNFVSELLYNTDLSYVRVGHETGLFCPPCSWLNAALPCFVSWRPGVVVFLTVCVWWICRSVEQADVPVTHRDPIHAIAYNQNFKQLITCSDGSVRVTLFEMMTTMMMIVLLSAVCKILNSEAVLNFEIINQVHGQPE